MRYCKKCGTETMVCVNDAVALGNTWEMYMCKICLTELQVTTTTTERTHDAEVNIKEQWKYKQEYIVRTDEEVKKLRTKELLNNDN